MVFQQPDGCGRIRAQSLPPGQQRWERGSPRDTAAPRTRAIRAPRPYNKLTQPEAARVDGF
jgi:hypothetical protein